MQGQLPRCAQTSTPVKKGAASSLSSGVYGPSRHPRPIGNVVNKGITISGPTRRQWPVVAAIKHVQSGVLSESPDHPTIPLGM